jgi:hypothetical protein
MSNWFDEIVEKAVDGIQDGPKKAAAISDKPNRNKVLSPERSVDGPKQPPKAKARRAPTTAGDNEPALALARGFTRALVTKTVRFRPELAEALSRIALQNKLAGRRPDTIQDLVNEATESWVKSYKPSR